MAILIDNALRICDSLAAQAKQNRTETGLWHEKLVDDEQILRAAYAAREQKLNQHLVQLETSFSPAQRDLFQEVESIRALKESWDHEASSYLEAYQKAREALFETYTEDQKKLQREIDRLEVAQALAHGESHNRQLQEAYIGGHYRTALSISLPHEAAIRLPVIKLNPETLTEASIQLINQAFRKYSDAFPPAPPHVKYNPGEQEIMLESNQNPPPAIDFAAIRTLIDRDIRAEISQGWKKLPRTSRGVSYELETPYRQSHWLHYLVSLCVFGALGDPDIHPNRVRHKNQFIPGGLFDISRNYSADEIDAMTHVSRVSGKYIEPILGKLFGVEGLELPPTRAR